MTSTMLGAFLDIELARTEKRARFVLRSTAKPSLIQGHHPPGSVLLRTVAASICGSDLCGKGGGRCGGCWRKPLDYLQLLQEHPSFCGGTGHELLGEVVHVIEPSILEVGQRVLAFSPAYFKGTLKDEFQQRSGVQDLAVFEDQGGFAEYFLCHEAVCIPVPTTTKFDDNDNFDPLWFVTAQPLATVLHACQHLENIMGKTVAIVGQGQNGLMMTQLLAGFRPRRLIVMDLLEERLEVARENYNVTHTLHVQQGDDNTMIEAATAKVLELTKGELCDVVVDMVGHQHRTVDLCAKLTKNHGTVLLFGLPPAIEEVPFAIRSHDFKRNLHYITTNAPPMACFEHAVELLEQGRFDPSALITHTLPFESFPEAFDTAQNYRDGVVKVLLTFENKDDD
jgi:threonine dehydrogenase-like Zn-dependent dehydrogenase